MYRFNKIVIIPFICLIMILCATCVQAATTKYKGVDYSKVYDFDYYVAHNSYVREHYSNSPKKAIKYFVKKGMKKRQQAIATFDVNSYIYGNKDLRRLYKNNYKKYYLHYMNKGYKSSARKATATGIKKMTNYCMRYAGVEYDKVYDFNYYLSNNKNLKKKFGVDDLAAFEYFMEYDIYRGVQASASFNVKNYINANPDLKKKFGNDYKKYYDYYVTVGYKTKTENVSAYDLPVDVLPIYEESNVEPSKSSSTRKYAASTINGKRTLKSYLQNSLVPCGRTLYIWGGGWDDSDASVIGYQSQWNTFFKKHNGASYDYTKYRYSYGNGLDCSGFAAWVIYNTLYTKSGGAWLVYQSTTVAEKYKEKGWATLAKNSSDQTYKPGDVVSMNGHVWISLGQCSDKSVLLIHSSPKGVQISGTSGRAATLATYYMKKYFPEWPYDARTVGSSYLKYAGKARWKTSGSGHILSDPDGIQNMSADKVMKTILGS